MAAAIVILNGINLGQLSMKNAIKIVNVRTNYNIFIMKLADNIQVLSSIWYTYNDKEKEETAK